MITLIRAIEKSPILLSQYWNNIFLSGKLRFELNLCDYLLLLKLELGEGEGDQERFHLTLILIIAIIGKI